MQSPILSIILPVYNGELFLERALKSVLHSTLVSWELIIVNDGSTDFTENICQTYCQKDKRIHFISQDNRGLSAARNAGFSHAIGDYIVYLDADDYIEPDYYKQLVYEAQKSQADFIVTGFVREFQRKKGKHSVQTQWPRKLLQTQIEIQNACKESWFYHAYIHVWNKIYRREYLIEKQIYFDESLRYGEDVPYNLQLLYMSDKILFSDITGYHYICHSQGQLTGGWRQELPEYNAKIFQMISEQQKKSWQNNQPVIAAGMYLRSCCLTIEKMTSPQFSQKDKWRMLYTLVQKKETVCSCRFCKGHWVPFEFRIYSYLFSSGQIYLIYCFIIIRQHFKIIMGR